MLKYTSAWKPSTTIQVFTKPTHARTLRDTKSCQELKFPHKSVKFKEIGNARRGKDSTTA